MTCLKKRFTWLGLWYHNITRYFSSKNYFLMIICLFCVIITYRKQVTIRGAEMFQHCCRVDEQWQYDYKRTYWPIVKSFCLTSTILWSINSPPVYRLNWWTLFPLSRYPLVTSLISALIHDCSSGSKLWKGRGWISRMSSDIFHCLYLNTLEFLFERHCFAGIILSPHPPTLYRVALLNPFLLFITYFDQGSDSFR